jgi:putative FmdB family regulatory protein
MPIYEYVCRECGGRFQRMRSMSERLNPPACGSCGSARTSLALSLPGRVGGQTAPERAVGACGLDSGSCCGGACMH